MLNKCLQLFGLILLVICLAPASHAFEDDDLLEPDKAFAFSAEIKEPGIITARWKIAEGYYLYRDKFKFSTEDSITLAKAEMPQGKMKKDEIFGNVETYRNMLEIKIPYEKADPATVQAELKTAYQGCADIGVCYPPQKKTTALQLASVASVSVNNLTAGKLDLLSNLNQSLGGNNEDELLPPDEAFKFNASLSEPNFLTANWLVADKYYLYKNKIKLSLENASGLSLGKPEFPQALQMNDPTYGDVEIYRGPLTLNFPILGIKEPPKSLNVSADFQGCADLGVCYPPINKKISFDPAVLAKLSPGAASAASNTDTQKRAANNTRSDNAVVSEQDAIAAKLSSGNTLLTLISFFGFGLLLAFTPCVFPMIPILSGIIVGEGENISTSRGFMLALAYVLAMALAYTAVGVLAGLFGANLQIWFQNPWILGIFALIFILLSLSMFGFYELQMPASVQTKLTSISNKQEGGKLMSAAIMGLLSALIVGPCVTAPLIGALIYIGQTGNAVLGGMALFVLSLGMGAPLLLIGASAGKLLPRAGMWMDAVKAVFGVMMIGVAIWLLERVLPASIIMSLWGLLLIVSAVYMGALRQIPEGISKWALFWKGLGVALLIYGSMMLIGAAAGSHNILQPLKGIVASNSGKNSHETEGLAFQQIKGEIGFNQALETATASGKTLMLDFYADWCISCKEMEKLTFTDAGVKASLAGTVLLQADVTANDDKDKALMKKFGIIGPPAILYFDSSGNERKNYRVVGFKSATEFSQHSTNALKP